jgi:hypothetical protein
MSASLITPERAARCCDFNERADHSPSEVEQHPRGWRYIQVHAFGDELEVLARIGMRPEDCQWVDAWAELAGEVTLIESRATRDPAKAGLFARQTEKELGFVYLMPVILAPYVTRPAFEAAMERYVEIGWPDDPRFRLDVSSGYVRVY